MRTFLRIFITIGLLVWIFLYVSPITAAEKIRDCDKTFLLFAMALAPVYVFIRMLKWFLLVRQVDEHIRLKDQVSDYLWGMAIGLVTPGRIGELTRVRNLNVSKKRSAGLFILEKFLEVSVLAILCLTSLILQRLVPLWVLFAGFAGVLIMFFLIPKAVGLLPERLKEIESAIVQLKISGCTFCSFLCFAIFCVQVFIVLKSMNDAISPEVIVLFPIILLGNLLPVTIGGFGMREAFAILILRPQNISSEVAMSSMAVVGLLDLVFPALIGIFMNFYSGEPHAKPNE